MISLMAMMTSRLRNLDLNLLLAFSVLMRERSVSRAAKQLHMGQSGMSGALARLRETFDDPLLVRVGRVLEPTPRALALVEPVDRALALVEHALSSDTRFSPEGSERTFALGLTDDHELLFAAPLAGVLAQQAPRARLVVRAMDPHTFRAALDEGTIDVAVTGGSEVPSWQVSTELYEQRYVCLWSPRQLGAMRRITLARYVALPHALVTFRGDLSGSVDSALAEHGLERRVVVGVPRFAGIPAILEALPVLATVPEPLGVLFVRQHGLRCVAPPLALQPRTIRMVHRRRDGDAPEQRWFRKAVSDVVHDVRATMPTR